ncbi:MAG: trypsin-like peptidase domain-containing protein [Deltaproteobacteria bacterium]|nr:MAG: trypsin-like peptidase domain-containing protein [Deltaproteobacteria bacterium]
MRIIREITMKSGRTKRSGKVTLLGITALICLTCWVSPARADKEAKAARKIIGKWEDTVITVKMVIKERMIMEGREMNRGENKTEATATVIDPSGLAVLPLFLTDPSRISKIFSEGQFGMEGASGFNWDSEITDLKVLLSDGKEVPARIVLRDRDLDLAFVHPSEKLTKPIPALDLSKDAKPDILDRIVVLTRLGKVANRVPSVCLDRIQAVVKKPRTFYVPGPTAMDAGLGAPVFSSDGKVIGILMLRILPSKGTGIGNLFSGVSGMGMLPIVLPAEDIMEVGKQALEATDKSE